MSTPHLSNIPPAYTAHDDPPKYTPHGPHKTWHVYASMPLADDTNHFAIILHQIYDNGPIKFEKPFGYKCLCQDHDAFHLPNQFVLVGTLTGEKSDFDNIVKKDHDPAEDVLLPDDATRSSYRCLVHFRTKLKALRATPLIAWNAPKLSNVLGEILNVVVRRLEKKFHHLVYNDFWLIFVDVFASIPKDVPKQAAPSQVLK